MVASMMEAKAQMLGANRALFPQQAAELPPMSHRTRQRQQ